MPTLALALHIDSMGPVEALGFVVPLPISSSSFSRRCGWISGSRPSPVSSRRSSCSAWRCSTIPSRRRSAARSLLSRRAQRDYPDLRHAGGRGRRSVAPAIRGQHSGRDRARSHHQPVRPARLAAGGRAADGRRRRDRERDPPGRGDVRRFPQLYRRRQHAARRRKWWTGSTARSRCWSISSTAMAAS